VSRRESGESEPGMKRSGLLSVVAMIAVGLLVAASWAGENAGRPKVLGIAFVTFKVTDLEKAKMFYGHDLGLPSAPVRNGNAEFANAVQASFAMNPCQRVDLAQTAPGTTGSYLVAVGLATDDLMKMRTYLTAKGVAANDIFAWPDGTRYFETQDPEGNKIVFVQESNWGKSGKPEGSISHKMIHAGFIVKDAASEDRFYKDLLGFHVYWHGGMKEGETNWVAMQVPDGSDWIEYMLKVESNPDKHTLGVMNHISLGVKSIQAAAKSVEKNGIKGHEEPKIGKDGKWQLNLYDPDETRVEFMEFTPVQKPCCSELTGTNPKP
jgi:catechol 2,3-dioxygenase-like lactoylglutathione lyase family enzyme